MSNGHTNRGRNNNNNNNNRRSRHAAPRAHNQGQTVAQRRVEPVRSIAVNPSATQANMDNMAADSYESPLAEETADDQAEVTIVALEATETSEVSEVSADSVITTSAFILEAAQFAPDVEQGEDVGQHPAPDIHTTNTTHHHQRNAQDEQSPNGQARMERGPASSSIRAPFAPGQGRLRPTSAPRTPAAQAPNGNHATPAPEASQHGYHHPQQRQPQRLMPPTRPAQFYTQSMNHNNNSNHNYNNNGNGAHRPVGYNGTSNATHADETVGNRSLREPHYHADQPAEHPTRRPLRLEPPPTSYQDGDDDEVFTFESNRDVRGDIGPLIDSLRELFEHDRSVASQNSNARCGICYLHYPLSDLQYREEEGYYVCATCARSLAQNRIMMVRRQQHA